MLCIEYIPTSVAHRFTWDSSCFELSSLWLASVNLKLWKIFVVSHVLSAKESTGENGG